MLQQTQKRGTLVYVTLAVLLGLARCDSAFVDNTLDRGLAATLTAMLASSGLTITPAAPTIAVRATSGLKASGGIAPYTYSILSGGGTIDANGFFTAPDTAGTTVVQVRDSLAGIKQVSITVVTYADLIRSTSALARYYRMTDSSNASVGGAVAGTLSFTNGAIANDSDLAAVFNGATNVNNIASVLNPASEDFTAELWFRPSVLSTTTGHSMLAQENGGSGVVWLGINTPTNQQIGTRLGGVTNTANVNAAVNTWYHTVVVKNGSSVQMYINGVVRSAAAVTPASSTGTMSIGSVGSPANAFFSGAIDEVAIYTRALTADEIQLHFLVGQGRSFALDPATSTATVNLPASLQPVGGTAPYTYTLVSGTGSLQILQSSVLFTPSDSGTATIRATDALGNTADATITASYSPYSFGGLQLWLTQAAITQADGTSVAAWADLSGQSRSAVQFTGPQQPVYRASSSGSAINGRAAVDFNAANTHMNIVATGFASLFAGNGQMTFAAVTQNTSLVASQTVFDIGTTGPDFLRPLVVEAGVFRMRRAGFAVDGPGASDTNPHVFVSTFDGTNGVVYRDGVAGASVSMAASATLGAIVRVGNNTNLAADFFKGRIGDIILFNRVLSATERKNLSCYLGTTYGITVSGCP